MHAAYETAEFSAYKSDIRITSRLVHTFFYRVLTFKLTAYVGCKDDDEINPQTKLHQVYTVN